METRVTPSEIAKIDAVLDRDAVEIDTADEADLCDWADRFALILDREVLIEEVWEWLDQTPDEDDEAYGFGV